MYVALDCNWCPGCFIFHSYPTFKLPYALDVHLPPVTCVHYCGNCPEELIASLHTINSKRMAKRETNVPRYNITFSVCLFVCVSVILPLHYCLPTYLFVPILCKGTTCSIAKTVRTVLSPMVLVVCTACIVLELKVYLQLVCITLK